MFHSNQYSSHLLEQAVESFNSLPGIGRRTALKLALFMLKQPKENVSNFANNILSFRNDVKRCKICHNISNVEVCSICSDQSRDNSIICVVQDVQDVLAIENTRQFRGLYHVLGGVISPVDGIGPSDLYIDSLVERAASKEINEIIFAISSTTEGETTKFFLSKKLSQCNVKLSSIASGVSVGEELEYTDEITLGNSIINRVKIN